jgi:hypothetical protein
LEIGIVTGIILSLAGAQVCASVVSPIAVGAGSIVMGWSFGLAHAFAIGRFGSSGPLSPFNGVSVRSDMFMAVVGGPIGLSAPGWLNNFPPLVIVFLLAAMATAMATTGWLMAQPRIAAGIGRPASDSVGDSGIVGRWLRWFRNHPSFAGIACGILAGAGIGLVYGFTQALAPVFQQFEAEPTESFVAAFGLIGGLVFGTTTWARTRSAQKGAAFGVLHAGFAVALCFLVIHAPDGVARLIALSAASAYFHATWFTAAFVLGDQIGSVRSAVVATTVEGALGFTVFVIFRMIHG